MLLKDCNHYIICEKCFNTLPIDYGSIKCPKCRSLNSKFPTSLSKPNLEYLQNKHSQNLV